MRGLAATRPGGAARLAAMRISRHAALHCGRAGTAGLAITGVPEGHGSWACGVERSDPAVGALESIQSLRRGVPSHGSCY